MKLLILKSLTTHERHIDFSKLTAVEQMDYILKEVQELDNAALFLEGHNTQENKEYVAQENLDVIQTCVQHLRLLEKQGVDLEKAVEEHNNKLLEKRNGAIEQVYFLQNIEKDKVYVIDNKNHEKGNSDENKAGLNGGVKKNEAD